MQFLMRETGEFLRCWTLSECISVANRQKGFICWISQHFLKVIQCRDVRRQSFWDQTLSEERFKLNNSIVELKHAIRTLPGMVLNNVIFNHLVVSCIKSHVLLFTNNILCRLLDTKEFHSQSTADLLLLFSNTSGTDCYTFS